MDSGRIGDSPLTQRARDGTKTPDRPVATPASIEANEKPLMAAIEQLSDRRLAVAQPEGGLRAPPHNIEAEQALLGAILVNNDAFDRVSDFLKPEHFSEELHRRVYEVLSQLIRAGKVATVVTLKTYLADADLGTSRAQACRAGGWATQSAGCSTRVGCSITPSPR